MVVDLSVAVAEYVFVELNNLSRRSAMIKTECDLYPDDLNLKKQIQIERRAQLNFDNNTEFPSDFQSNFLRENENTRVFYPDLVDKILEKAYYKDKIMVVTRNEKIEMNLKGTLANINMPDSLHSEVDMWIIFTSFPVFTTI